MSDELTSARERDGLDPPLASSTQPSTERSTEWPSDGLFASTATNLRSVRYADDPPDEWGNYRIGEVVGRGGAGTVYLAFDSKLEREVAVKVCRGNVASDVEGRARFLNDARAASRLDHPCIVPIHELGELPDGRPYFAMKHVVGETLSHALSVERPFDRFRGAELEPEYLEVFRRVAEAIAHAHDRDVIHGDLKPQNVMLASTREVYVVDWGFSRADAPTEEGEVIGGTIAYVAPEFVIGHGSRDGRRSDVWGLGAILCEILTGSPPLRATSKRDARREFEEGGAAAIAKNLASAPPDVAEIALRCLAIDPLDRFENARTVANAVADVLDARRRRLGELEIESVTAKERERAAIRRGVQKTALTASIALTIVLVAAYALSELRQGRSEAANARVTFHRAYDDAVRKHDTLLQEISRGRLVERSSAEPALVAAQRAEELSRSAGVDAVERARASNLVEELRRTREAIDRFALLSQRLDDLRPHFGVAVDLAMSAESYARVFFEAGLDVLGDPDEFERAVRGSGRAEEIIAGLDAWSLTRRTGSVRVANPTDVVVRLVDACDDDEWRRRVRECDTDESSRRLLELAAESMVTPRSNAAMRLLADRLLVRSEGATARDLLVRIAVIDFSDARLQHDLAMMYEMIEPVDLQSARAHLFAALALDPGSAHLLTDLAIQETKSQRHEAALEYARRARRLAPDSPRAAAIVGACLSSLGELDAAIESYESAVGFGWTPARPILAETLFLTGRLARSRYFATLDAEANPDSADAQIQIGRILVVIEDYSSAMKWLDRSIELAPNDARALLLRATALAHTGRDVEAMQMLAQARTSVDQERDGAFLGLFEMAHHVASLVGSMRADLMERGDLAVLSDVLRLPPPARLGPCIVLEILGRPDLAFPLITDVTAGDAGMDTRLLAIRIALSNATFDPSRRVESLAAALGWFAEAIDAARLEIRTEGEGRSRDVRRRLEVLALLPGLRELREDAAFGVGEEAAQRKWRETFKRLDAFVADPLREDG